MKCDIIIPTYNNASQITGTLESLLRQAVPAGWSARVIISDDGSTDETLLVAEKQTIPAAWEVVVVTGPHTGPAGARNRALTYLAGDIVLLLGADVWLRPHTLAEHLIFHEKHPAATSAALGMVRWDPRLRPTPLMEWMIHGGQQNDFDSLLGSTLADPAHFFYGSHLSLKRILLQHTHFPETFAEYGWEDVSVGRELKKQDLKLHVLHTAIGLHRHFYTVTAIRKRQRAAGFNLKPYQNLYPDVAHSRYRSRAVHIRRLLWHIVGGQALLVNWLRVCETKTSFPRLFLVFTSMEFWKGVWRSQGGFLAFLRENSMISSKSD